MFETIGVEGKYVKKLVIITEGVKNMAIAINHDNTEEKGDWNEIKFRSNIFQRMNGWTKIEDKREWSN